jgi:hypothetical protein
MRLRSSPRRDTRRRQRREALGDATVDRAQLVGLRGRFGRRGRSRGGHRQERLLSLRSDCANMRAEHGLRRRLRGCGSGAAHEEHRDNRDD